MKDYMPEETVDALSKHLADLANSVQLPDTVKSNLMLFFSGEI